MRFIIFLFPLLTYCQIDLTACAVNITDNATIETDSLETFDNYILLQSGTTLKIGSFTGRTRFIHGLKARETPEESVKPVLIIKSCYGWPIIKADKSIKTYLGDGCNRPRTNTIFTINR